MDDDTKPQPAAKKAAATAKPARARTPKTTDVKKAAAAKKAAEEKENPSPPVLAYKHIRVVGRQNEEEPPTVAEVGVLDDAGMVTISQMLAIRHFPIGTDPNGERKYWKNFASRGQRLSLAEVTTAQRTGAWKLDPRGIS